MHLIIFAAAAIGMFQLGALTVLASVLALALKGIVAVLLLAGVVVLAVTLWRKLKARPDYITVDFKK